MSAAVTHMEPTELLEKLRALQRSIPFAPFTILSAEGVEHEIKSPEQIHFWPHGKTIAVCGENRIDYSLNVSSIKLIKVTPVEKTVTDKITVEIDHDIYERFCNEARRRSISPEEEAKRVITARALEDAVPEVVPRQSAPGNLGDA